MIVSWVHVVVLGICSLASGFAGGCAVAFRWGRWRQRIEDRIEANERRLEKGDAHVDKVPLLVERVDILIKTVDEIKSGFREFTSNVVTRSECDWRHGNG